MMHKLLAGLMTLTMLVCFCGTARAQETDVKAAHEALLQAYLKYDKQISAMLDKGQDQAFNVVNEDTHAIYFEERPLTRANINGYQAFLQQKLHLTPAQQDKLYWIERRMYSECEKKWKRWQELKGAKTP